MNTLLTLFNVDGIFCDALVNDDQDDLIFASLWGRDTAIQELLARLTLSSSEGGIAQLIFRGQNPKAIHLGNPDRLDKLTGRMPKAIFLAIWCSFGYLINGFKNLISPIKQRFCCLMSGKSQLLASRMTRTKTRPGSWLNLFVSCPCWMRGETRLSPFYGAKTG